MSAGLGTRVLAILAATAIGITAAPPDANALEVADAEVMARQIVEEARSQAEKARPRDSRIATETSRAGKASRKPLARTELVAGGRTTLESAGAGVSAEFSGYKVRGALDVVMTPVPETVAAAAAFEVDGKALGHAVEITATSEGGTEVTSFPAEVETAKDEHGVESTVDVTPGITLGFDVDQLEMERAGIDPSTAKIYTREADSDPWTELPSYYDAELGKVIGESDHLSQFVVIGSKFVPPPGPRIVLDPDDDYGWAETPAPATELPYNVALSNLAAAKLSKACLAPVMVTRQADVKFVSGKTRAKMAAAFKPKLTVTIAFDALKGSAWGTEDDGGTFLYARTAGDKKLAAQLVKWMPEYTGRPSDTRAANDVFPDPAFADVPGAMAHMETLYLDHNFDRPVIDKGFESIANGVAVSLAKYAETKGFDCTDPKTGGLPKPPSKAQLKKWRHLGHQNYQTYGADPVSFSTGNLVEDEELFALTGPGEQALDFTLTYNSQDGRLSRVGAGWSFGLGARAQRFDDGSVLVVRGDGASFVFTKNKVGKYVGESGLGLTLSEAGSGRLDLRSDAGERWRFDAADIEGIGELVSHTERQGNTVTLGYAKPNEDVQQFVPLTTITDAAGQTVKVKNDTKGRITALTHPDGRQWKLSYNAAGDLTKITAPDGGVRTFTYDSAHRMLTATDAVGVTYLKNQYDASGRVVKQWDSNGKLRSFAYGNGTTKYTNAEGKTTAFSWDANMRITRIQDAAGGVTTFAFDTASRVTASTAPDGRVTKYSYDSRGNVATETRPDGGKWTYTWTPTGELTSSTDPLGRVTKHQVNAKGLTTRTVRPDGSVIDYGYTSRGDLASVKHPSGAVESFSYDARGNLIKHVSPAGRTTGYAYDSANRVIGETDGTGHTTSYAYDKIDNLVKATDPLNRVTHYAYNRNGQMVKQTAADGGVTTYQWDKLFRVVKTTDPGGGSTSYAYNKEDGLVGETDALGNTTKYQLDPLKRVTQVTDPLGGIWGAEVDKMGRVTAETDPDGNITRTDYDAAGRVSKETDAEGGVREYTYDAVGNLIRETDPEGGIGRYTYDELDRLVETVDPDGRATSYSYDADDHLIAVIDPVGAASGYVVDADGLILTSTDALGASTTFEYDGNGSVTAVTDPLGARTETAYDDAGQPVLETDPLGGETRTEFDQLGRETANIDPAGNRTETHYDKSGRIVAVVNAVGAVTKYSYDKAGRQTGAIDADGRQTAYSYDAAGQLIRVVEGSGNQTATTAYAYTDTGLLETVTDPRGGVSRYTYDRVGRRIGAVDAAGATRGAAYDKLGRLTAEWNGAGQTRRFDYSKGGLIAKMSDPAGQTTFEYDGAGRMILMQDPTGPTAWRYDLAGQLLSETSPRKLKTALAYDAAGRVTGTTLPGGKQLAYHYDALDRLVEQQTPWGDQGYEWRADSVLTAIDRSGGVRTDIVSDAVHRPIQITHAEPAAAKHSSKPAASGGALKRTASECPANGAADYLKSRRLPAQADPVKGGGALRFGTSYTPGGNVSRSTREILGALGGGQERPVLEALTREYGYDLLGRLASDRETRKVLGTKKTSSEVVSERSYEYDAAGNRILSTVKRGASTVKVAQEFGAGNRLTKRTTTGGARDGRGTRTFAYDGAGRRVSEQGAGPSARYGYGYDNTPTTVRTGKSGKAGSTAVETRYDGLGRVATQQIGTQYGSDTVSYAYLGDSETSRKSSRHGTTTQLWDALGELAGIGENGEDEARWSLLDRLGSVVAEATGPGGADIAQLADYGDYGVPGYESTGFAQTRGYTGEVQDGATGAMSFGSRSYDPAGGAWMAPDAWPGLLEAPQSLNRYGYVLGNPATFADEGGFIPYEPGYSVTKKGNKWVYTKKSPPVQPRTVNPSALLNHVDRKSYYNSTGRTLLTPSGAPMQDPSGFSDDRTQIRHREVSPPSPVDVSVQALMAIVLAIPGVSVDWKALLAAVASAGLTAVEALSWVAVGGLAAVTAILSMSGDSSNTRSGSKRRKNARQGTTSKPDCTPLELMGCPRPGQAGKSGNSLKNPDKKYIKDVLRKFDHDPHSFKREILGNKSRDISKFDIKIDGGKQLVLVRRGTGAVIHTGYFVG